MSVTRTVATCQQSEQQARDALASQWRSFPAADKRSCVAETNVGGFPSYVQVLVCLELARDARTMKVD
jgi:LAS superfamily LD-carboxypeptidase LdcB